MRQQHKASLTVSVLSLFLSSSWRVLSADGLGITITEIANRGSGEEQCNGEDWVELKNTLDTAIDMAGWKLYDDNGPDDEDAWTIPEGYSIDPGGYLVVCRDQEFLFGIGSNDSITIADSSGVVVDAVALAEGGPDDGATYALFEDDEFKYTTTPTPGEANVLTEPVPLMTQFQDQNQAGNDFFSMEGDIGKVIDMDFTIGEEELVIIRDHPAWEEWTTFDGLKITNAGDESATVVASVSSGNIRVRGQSSNTDTVCLGRLNVPFLIHFDSPFMGMERIYLRNHMSDPSYMRDHAAHTMLKAFGLPYLRTRPARVYINGEYIGFYTVMDTPDSGNFMQRSFGDFDPSKTALYKGKTFIDFCPFATTTNPFSFLFLSPERVDPNSPLPDPYYFERGDHRDDTPILNEATACQAFLAQQIMKEQSDIERGYYEYGEQCGATMVNLGRVDRDFGPKSTEDAMIEFLDQYFFNEDVENLAPAVDIDDWIKNIAYMAVLLHYDSPIGVINNWYLATTNGGDGDWKIAQYDHNHMMNIEIFSFLCSLECTPRMAYMPILQPTCGPIEEHKVVGRILNSDENMEKYLGYVSELVEILTAEDGVISDLYNYGDTIKEYIVEDPTFEITMEEYEDLELGEDIENYGIEGRYHLLKFTRFRVQQVKEQLEAINTGTLPRNGEYDPKAKCPDWRNDGTDIAKSASTPSENCAVPGCAGAGFCYSHDPTICNAEGEIIFGDCALASPFCDSCFPHSRCGSATDVDTSFTFVPNDDTCGDEFVDCELASHCFDHSSGRCAFDGSILTVDCQVANPFCKPCYPYSRCGSGELIGTVVSDPVTGSGEDGEEDVAADAGVFTPNDDTCGAGFELCADAGPCFDHDLGLCAEDGSFTNALCNDAMICKPCFPNSRCGGAGVTEEGPTDTVIFTPNDDTCGPELDLCADALPCFDNNMGICADDGSFSNPMCDQAAACAPCFPGSRCGVGGATSSDEEPGAYIPNDDTCSGTDLEQCKEASPCFDHTVGCLEDGSFGIELCEQAVLCKPCFPNSRCGTASTEDELDDTGTEDEPDDTGIYTPNNDTCSGTEFERCQSVGTCFDHSMGCGEDGSFPNFGCNDAIGCEPCYPNSRCGAATVDGDEEPEQKETEASEAAASGGVDRSSAIVPIFAVYVFSFFMMLVV